MPQEYNQQNPDHGELESTKTKQMKEAIDLKKYLRGISTN